jgi:hypothetical protein
MPFSVRKNPQTNQTFLVSQSQAEMWDGPHVIGLLRVIRQHFPDEFDSVGRELVLNGRATLQLPDDIGGKVDGP